VRSLYLILLGLLGAFGPGTEPWFEEFVGVNYWRRSLSDRFFTSSTASEA